MRPTVLTVDDSKTVRIIVRKAMRTFDCEVLEAANGVEGLAIAARRIPDLILLDLMMPVMDGVETFAMLKADATLKTIPVMMLMSGNGREQIPATVQAEVRDCLAKPFDEEALLEKCGRIIELKPRAEIRANSVPSVSL